MYITMDLETFFPVNAVVHIHRRLHAARGLF